MKKDIKEWEGIPIELDDMEWLIAQQSFRSELQNRKLIWSFIVKNEPVPQELKPLLYSILSDDYKAKNKEVTKQFWDMLALEIWELIETKGATATEAIAAIAKKHHQSEKTLNQEYYRANRLHLRSKNNQSLFDNE